MLPSSVSTYVYHLGWMLGRRLLFAVLALGLAAPVAHAEPVFEKYKVPTVGGAEINVEVMRPEGGARAPVILTYSPYNTLGEYTAPNLANDGLGQTYVPKGYARAVADVLGTRNSSGCWDYGGADEQQSGVDLVNFLARQPWSSGRVAMIGGSYDGTTANMVAARGGDAPGLAAIVPEAAISRWYGYAYYDGVRYFLNSEVASDEGFDTPLGFDFGLARTPPTDPSDPLFAEKVASRANPCESEEHTVKGYDRTPDYDAFWRERDYLKDARNFRAAVLLAHGWQDYNVKQEEGSAGACRSSAPSSSRAATRRRAARRGMRCSMRSSSGR
jgi:X-Pro dipeptidyl-peptidase